MEQPKEHKTSRKEVLVMQTMCGRGFYVRIDERPIPPMLVISRRIVPHVIPQEVMYQLGAITRSQPLPIHGPSSIAVLHAARYDRTRTKLLCKHYGTTKQSCSNPCAALSPNKKWETESMHVYRATKHVPERGQLLP